MIRFRGNSIVIVGNVEYVKYHREKMVRQYQGMTVKQVIDIQLRG